MHVITSLWEGSATFYCFVSGFADLNASNNKPDGNSNFIGQQQCVEVNTADKGVWQRREVTPGMTSKGGLQIEREEEWPERLV